MRLSSFDLKKAQILTSTCLRPCCFGILHRIDDFEGDSAGDTEMSGPSTSSTAAAAAGSTYPYLARVTNGHKFKISTKVCFLLQQRAVHRFRGLNCALQVNPSEYEAFTSRFTTLLKSSMAPRMKKKEKKRPQPSQTGKAGAASSKAGSAPTGVTLPPIKGSARGKNHSKRQRSVKSRQKVLDRLQAKKLVSQQVAARLEELKRNIESGAPASAES